MRYAFGLSLFLLFSVIYIIFVLTVRKQEGAVKMLCEKCGSELDDSAVFCDKCGSFVMSGDEYSDIGEVESAGKRVRNRSSFWLFFKIAAWIVAIAAGIIAAVCGYNYMMNQPVTYNKVPYQTDSKVWGDSWVEVPALSNDNKPVYNNPYNGQTDNDNK